MNAKKLLLFAMTLGVCIFSTISNAYWVHRGYGYGYDRAYVRSVPVYCRYVSGYWANGYYHAPHRVCWRR